MPHDHGEHENRRWPGAPIDLNAEPEVEPPTGEEDLDEDGEPLDAEGPDGDPEPDIRP